MSRSLENGPAGCYAGRVRKDVTIRRAQAADLPALVSLWLDKMALQQLVDRRIKMAPDAAAQRLVTLETWLDDAASCVFVATVDERTPGYIVGCERPNQPGLLPRMQGQVLEMTLAMHSDTGGPGLELWRAMQGWFLERGLEESIVQVSRRQPVEQAFWRSLKAGEISDCFWLPL